jgi:hypothetical protein
MADEVTAIAAQQASAGDGHSPVQHPQPRSDLEMAALAEGSSDHARDACAQLLEEAIEACRVRGEPAIALAELQDLALRMRAEPERRS